MVMTVGPIGVPRVCAFGSFGPVGEVVDGFARYLALQIDIGPCSVAPCVG